VFRLISSTSDRAGSKLFLTFIELLSIFDRKIQNCWKKIFSHLVIDGTLKILIDELYNLHPFGLLRTLKFLHTSFNWFHSFWFDTGKVSLLLSLATPIVPIIVGTDRYVVGIDVPSLVFRQTYRLFLVFIGTLDIRIFLAFTRNFLVKVRRMMYILSKGKWYLLALRSYRRLTESIVRSIIITLYFLFFCIFLLKTRVLNWQKNIVLFKDRRLKL